MSWTLESAANDLERCVLSGEPPSVDAVAMMVAWARCGMLGRQTCRNVYNESRMNSCINGFECSECGNLIEDCEGYRVEGTFNYCSKCGAVAVGRKPTKMGAFKK